MTNRKDLSSQAIKEIREKVDLGLLDEDDEFEEFPAEDWQGKDNNQDLTIWEDNWDDDNIEDSFSEELKNQLYLKGFKS